MSEAGFSDLGFIEKLLEGAEVKWLPLGEICDVLRGKRLTKNKLSEKYSFPVFHGGLEPLGFYDRSNRPANSTMIINVGASAGTVGYSQKKFWSSDGCYCISQSEMLNSKYLLHFLRNIQHQIIGKVRYAGIPTLDAIVVERLLIPIPCPEDPKKSLAIQAEIVRILDAFTKLTAELTAELKARVTQYNHYRDQLLTFDDNDVKWLPLGEVTTLRRGRVMSKGYLIESIGKYPVYSSQTERNGMIGSIDSFDFNGEFVSWTTDGANAGTVFYRTGKFSVTNVCGVIKNNGTLQINLKFLYYWLSIEAKKHVYPGMGNPKLMSHQVEKIPIPIPYPKDPKRSLEEQARIVAILDKFDTLTHSITEGLPREIALRQQQYEYYRDLLLSFPNKAA